MRWLPLAISMYATLFSSISYIMAPAEAFRYDMQWFVALAMFPLASIFAIVLFIDFYTRLGITTVYEYIEVRFNRLLSTFILIIFGSSHKSVRKMLRINVVSMYAKVGYRITRE